MTDPNTSATPSNLVKKDIDKYLKRGLNFLKKCVKNDDYFNSIEPTSDGYIAYNAIKEVEDNVESINIILLTNNIARQYVPDDVKVKKITVKFDVYDFERLYHVIMEDNSDYKPLIIRLKNKYGKSLQMIKAEGSNPTYDCYVGIIPGELLARIYSDEGQDLIQKNVRSYLQARGKVNRGIKNTLAKEPEMFMAYNNGISTIADSVELESFDSNNQVVSIKEITGWQIVNGGQTTASIYNAYKSKLPLDQVNVQIKLSVIKKKDQAEDIIHNISKYANSQNKINMSDFNANDDYHIEMERISRRTYIPTEKGKPTEQWFYERARGQYLTEINRQPTVRTKRAFKERIPSSRCISKTVAAKCLMDFMGYPHYVSKGLESNFVTFSGMIKKGTIPEPSPESFKDLISKVILFKECDKIVASQNFGGYKAQINNYVVALIGKYYSDLFDSKKIWEIQNITPELANIIEELAYKVWTHFENPTIKGVNISQWCKKEECWTLLQSRFEKNEL